MKTKRPHWKKITTVMVVVLSILMSLMVAGCSGDSSDKSGGETENKYTTPVQRYVDALNNKNASKAMDMRVALLNGLLESEVNDMLALMKKSDDGKEYLEYQEESVEESIAYLKDEYGSDYKTSYEIMEKTELDKDELSNMKDILKNAAETIAYEVDRSKDWDSDDWEAAAEDMDLTVSQTKEYYKIAEKIVKTLKNADVSEGYELDVNIKITGSKLDEPKEDRTTFVVYKIDGRWVGNDFLKILQIFL